MRPARPRGRPRPARALVCAAICAASTVVSGAAAPAPARSHGIAIAAGDASGGAAALGAQDLRVELEGVPLQVTGLDPIEAGDWSLLVYVDLLALRPGELERVAPALAASSRALAELGAVTLVVADTLTEAWLEDESDPEALRAAFAELAAAGAPPAPGSQSAENEAERRRLLLGTVARSPRSEGARAVIVVGDANAERGGASASSGSAPRGESTAASRGATAAAVASLGWVALPIHPPGEGEVLLSPLAEETGGEAIRELGELEPALARLGRRRLLRLGAAGGDGGDAGGSPRAEGAAARAGAPVIAPLAVTGPEGVTLRAARWLATATPDFVLLARLQGLLVEGESGELEVEAAASLEADPGGEPLVAVEVLAGAGASAGGAELAAVAASPAGLRASFVLARLEEAPILVHHRGEGVELDGASSWLLQARLDAPGDLDQVAVVVEELATGRWGAAVAALESEPIEVESGARVVVEVADLRAPADPEPSAGAPRLGALEDRLIRLVPPRARVLRGVQTFRAMSLNAFIRRVVFLLDGKEAAEDRDDPFAARLDLGSDPRPREVRAVAYDAAGRRLGEDVLLVNRPRTAFDVDIVEVRVEPGPVEVETRVSVPPRRRVERLELYWNETLVETVAAPPWTARLDVTPGPAGDYVRAVAHLDDGSSLEDVHLVGVAGQGEEVEVNLVEIFTVVLDREGLPVRDLRPEEVEVRLQGNAMELERFGVASDLPLDVGLVIDTSQSMEILMDDARAAAMRFLGDLVRPGDRAFLVDFDTKPRLAQGMTREVTRLANALGTLRAGGATALYDSILFSILHFEEGEDRRAVVLLTDGDDYRSRFSARQASLQARSAGVPIYMISLAGMDWMRPAMRKTDLETIAKQTGGHVFYVSAREELSAAYARIGEELRSQYVLAFATPRALTEAELAKLEVRVSRPGTEVRAVVAGRSIQTR